MREVWALPGYDVQALLGFGATGEVWRGRSLATGETVALKRLREDADPAAVDALRREAELLRSLDTPYVVRLREVVDSGAAGVLVLDHAPGGSLAALLARRGSLEPGEVVTVAAPLAQALAAAHRRGLVHGALTPSSVLFTADGMPLLSDLGLARFARERRGSGDGTGTYADPAVAAGGDPDAAADVWGLGAVCHHMLAGAPPYDRVSAQEVLSAEGAGRPAPLGLLAPSAPRALVAAVEAALAADPAARPDAASLASMLRRAHGAAPVRLTGAAPAVAPLPEAPGTRAVRTAQPREPERRRRRTPQGLLPRLALVALVVAAGVAGWLSGRSGTSKVPGLPAAVTAAAPVDWEQVLQELDSVRAQAFALADIGALTQVYAPGSAGLDSDAALLRSLADRGQTAHGLRREVHRVELLQGTQDRARLRVVDVLAAYEVRDAGGAVVSRAPARGEQAFLVDLTLTADGWRLVQVRRQS